MKDIAKLLKFTEHGHVVHYSSGHGYKNCTCSGYESPESFVKPYHWWADSPDLRRTHFESYEIPPEGIPVLDIRDATQTREGIAWVFRGPMVNADLADGAVNALPNADPIFAGAVAGNGFGTLLAHHIVARHTQKRGSLDYVSVAEYVAGWKEHGAKVGRFFFRDGEAIIAWENAGTRSSE